MLRTLITLINRVSETYLIIVLASTAMFSQQTDKASFFILYDVSGSMRTDQHGNSLLVLDTLLKKSKIASQYTLIFFGDQIRTDQSITQDYSAEWKTDSILAVRIKGFYGIRNRIGTTDIKVALDKVDAMITKDQISSGAVIIISDLRLENRDIPEQFSDSSSQARYRDAVKNRYTTIAKSIPIFSIQISDKPYDQFRDIELTCLKTSGTFSECGDYIFINNEFPAKGNKELLTHLDIFTRNIVRGSVKPATTIATQDKQETEPQHSAVPESVVAITKSTVILSTNRDALKDCLSEEVLDNLQNILDLIEKNAIDRAGLDTINALLASTFSDGLVLECLAKLSMDTKNAQNKALTKDFIGLSNTTPSRFEKLNEEPAIRQYGESIQNAIILGLADYLIERVKAEMLVIFNEEIKENVLDKSRFLADTLFRNTFALLKNHTAAINITLLRETFNQDLRKLPKNLIKHPRIATSPALNYLKYTLIFFDEMKKAKSVEGAIIALGEKMQREIGTRDKTEFERSLLFVSNYFRFLQFQDVLPVFQGNLSRETKHRFTVFLTAYLLADLKDIRKVKELVELSDKLSEVNERYLRLKGMIEELDAQIKNSTMTALDEVQEFKRVRTISILKYSTEILREGVKLTNHFSDAPLTSSHIDTYLRMADEIVDAYFMLEDNNYLGAVAILIPTISDLSLHIKNGKIIKSKWYWKKSYNTTISNQHLLINKDYLLTSIGNLDKISGDLTVPCDNGRPCTPETYRRKLDSLGIAFASTLFPQTPNHTIEIKAAKITAIRKTLTALLNVDANEPKTFRNFIATMKGNIGYDAIVNPFLASTILDYKVKALIQLAAELSTATTASEVKNIITSHSLPPASYRIKRREPFAITLNAYVGVAGSLYGEDVEGVLSTPIGFEYSRNRIGRAYYNPKGSKSYSLMVSLIDVGNVINYRIKDEPDETKDFKFDQIFSPGIFLNWGMSRRFPISLGAGYQFNPERFTAGIYFDLPLARIR